jgi:hypothetical protein
MQKGLEALAQVVECLISNPKYCPQNNNKNTECERKNPGEKRIQREKIRIQRQCQNS